jgi:hypothetical protein
MKDKNKFKFNREYIANNRLPQDIIQKAGIDLTADDEIFIRHPYGTDYYVSQYGRGISVKGNKVKLLSLTPGGGGYYYFKFSDDGLYSISVHRAVADVFCPDLWKTQDLQAHHIDKIRTNNYYENLILLPRKLHRRLEKIKKIILLKDGKFIEYKNPLDLMLDTGLKVEDIIVPDEDGRKPLKSQGKYTIYEIDGNLIGYQYYPKKGKDK